jgi:hypothetical protein
LAQDGSSRAAALDFALGLSPPEDRVTGPEDEAHRQPEHYPEIICGPKRFEQRDAKEDDKDGKAGPEIERSHTAS